MLDSVLLEKPRNSCWYSQNEVVIDRDLKISCQTEHNRIMAKRQCYFSITFVTAFIALCCVKSIHMTYTAQTLSQVVTTLNYYTSPVNYTMAKRFLKDVRDSEIGLCLNLSNAQNKTVYETAVVETTLVSLHIRSTNESSIVNSVLKFPCTSCSNLVSRSPLVEFALSNVTLPNISCLSASRFSADFEALEQNPLRLSDVLSLSLYDPISFKYINLRTSDTIYLEIPLVSAPNNSYNYSLKCLSQERNTSGWSNASCSTSQTIKLDNNTRFVQCNCSTLGSYAVFVKYFIRNNTNAGQNGQSPENHVVILDAQISLTLDAKCDLYLSNATIKANFLNTTKYSIAMALNTSVSNIVNMKGECGSIVVNFTLLSRDGSNGTLNKTILEFGQLITSESLKIVVDNAEINPLTLRVFNLTMLGSNMTFVSPYFYRKFATTTTAKPTDNQGLVYNYKPFIIAVAVTLFAVIFCVCCTCWSHSWYLHKKKYTEFNSDKVVPKVVIPVMEEEEDKEEVAPPEFPMTYTERPRVDERQMAKYDWARTSFAAEQSDFSAFVTPQAGQGPRLIVDCDSDEESEGLPPSEGASVSLDMDGESRVESESDEDGTLDGEYTRSESFLSVNRENASESVSPKDGSQDDALNYEGQNSEENVEGGDDDGGNGDDGDVNGNGGGGGDNGGDGGSGDGDDGHGDGNGDGDQGSQEENKETMNNEDEREAIAPEQEEDQPIQNDDTVDEAKQNEDEGTNEDTRGSSRSESASSRLEKAKDQVMPEPCM